ncbi:hypothetical protein Ahy_A01g000034 [Arachis hypogaea]|uniref:Aminotransferase-like plant mobile domain-containing protein n=1 Tax=Arachis hypogaea TaxID=3818 RepID=A0A445EJ57_ARAHY|nr:hypothetical protein Ahy_A01g000034 [Arachis hypogaea]
MGVGWLKILESDGRLITPNLELGLYLLGFQYQVQSEIIHKHKHMYYVLRRISHIHSPPAAIVLYLREAGFSDALPLRDFMFNNSLVTAFVERWHLETHTFHMSWGEFIITLQDVTYHLGLRANGEPVGGCFRDFYMWYDTGVWELVEKLLGARPPPIQQQRSTKEGVLLPDMALGSCPTDAVWY